MDDNTLEYFTLSDSMRMYIRDIEAQRGELLEVLERISVYPTARTDELSVEKIRSIAKKAIAKAKGKHE